MNLAAHENYIIIAPQIYVSLEAQDPPDLVQETKPRTTEITMVWIQDGNDFRLDINLPDSSVLDLYFSTQVGSLHINGETIWENNTPHAVGVSGVHVEMTPVGLRLTCTTCGMLHILARCAPETNAQMLGAVNQTGEIGR
jgi:hypothetical protein